ncbi:hypothetical protein [Halorhodospira halochloris]|uniref:hypothetical protein n=1 Tax=Halorhodospira halochloris TaxID=1052 RepID=UPI00076F6387|nr:hypothetical protein [Halorhodospira halochloris]
MNPSLEASWRHPWRQDLHSGGAIASGEFSRRLQVCHQKWNQGLTQGNHLARAPF